MSERRLSDIEHLVLQLDPEDRRRLLEWLANCLQAAPTPPRDLYGAWSGKFPADFDAEAAIREIRDQWREDRAA
jgi:hypothetical protein